MKITLILLSLLLSSCSTTTYYAKAGAGYKLHESDIVWLDGSPTSPISARLEVGAKSGSVIYGVSHRSQYFSGKPFNNNSEYEVTEVFVDYEYEF